MRAHITKVAGGLAIIGLLVVGGITQSAQAATYPSWSDVVKARKNAAAKATAVKQITELIANLEKDLQVATQIAQEKGSAYNEAQDQYLQADQRSRDLLTQADAAQKKADDAKTLAGRLGLNCTVRAETTLLSTCSSTAARPVQMSCSRVLVQ